MKINFSFGWKTVSIAVFGFIVVFAVTGFGVIKYTSSPGFCGGSCHTMTEQYDAWKVNKHHGSNNPSGVQAGCIECHFLPGDKLTLKAQIVGLRHLFAYLTFDKAPLPIRPIIPDGACLQSGCHSKDKFEDTELKFSEKKVKFKHKVHFSDKALDGHPLTCDTCHFKVSAEKHFEVPKEICFLCHHKLGKQTLAKAKMAEGKVQRISFKKEASINFFEGKSKCSICHVIPTKSLQKQVALDDPKKKAVTHQTLQEAGVPCESCHFDMVKGRGEIETGNVVSNGCLSCHNRSKKLLDTAHDLKLMHDKHVTTHRADCFDCHTTIEHKKQPNHLDFVRKDCVLCHEDQHKQQKMLLSGVTVEGIAETPMLMAGVNTNCMGCHVQKDVHKGSNVRTGNGEACAGCHTPEHKKMLDDWGKQVAKDLAGAKEVLAEALQALEAAKGVATEDKIKEAEEMVRKGQEAMEIVEVGNGVHNKKLSIMLLDEAFGNFEDTIDLLAEGG